MDNENDNRTNNSNQYRRDWAYAVRTLEKGDAPEKVARPQKSSRAGGIWSLDSIMGFLLCALNSSLFDRRRHAIFAAIILSGVFKHPSRCGIAKTCIPEQALSGFTHS